MSMSEVYMVSLNSELVVSLHLIKMNGVKMIVLPQVLGRGYQI